MNGAFFAVAAARRTDVVRDLSYNLAFALLAIALLFTGAREPVEIVASLLVLLWAIRLGGYLFRRILRMKVDHRFDGMRENPRASPASDSCGLSSLGHSSRMPRSSCTRRRCV